MKPLFGGIPTRKKWYISDRAGELHGDESFEVDDLPGDAIFTPVESSSAADAPVRKVFAVFVDGKRMKDRDYPNRSVVVAKVTDGRIVSFDIDGDRFCEFSLPRTAVLVVAGEFPAEYDFGLLGCIGIPQPDDRQRTILEALGVVFFDHVPFPGFRAWYGQGSVRFPFRGYVAAKLPSKWTTQVRGGRYFESPLGIQILDAEGGRVACIEQGPKGRALGAPWTGTLTLC